MHCQNCRLAGGSDLRCVPTFWSASSSIILWYTFTLYTLLMPQCEGCWCRQVELSEATDGFNEAAKRLDRAGSPNSAFLGVLPALSLDVVPPADGMQVVVRGYRDIRNGQARLDSSAAAAMAEAKHPNLLPLIGVSTESSSAVYGVMEVFHAPLAFHQLQ